MKTVYLIDCSYDTARNADKEQLEKLFTIYNCDGGAFKYSIEEFEHAFNVGDISGEMLNDFMLRIV